MGGASALPLFDFLGRDGRGIDHTEERDQGEDGGEAEVHVIRGGEKRSVSQKVTYGERRPCPNEEQGPRKPPVADGVTGAPGASR